MCYIMPQYLNKWTGITIEVRVAQVWHTGDWEIEKESSQTFYATVTT